MFVEVCLLLAALLVFLIIRDRKPSMMPPGRWEFPFLGQVPDMTIASLLSLRKAYGDVVTTRMGGIRTVYLFDYKTAKEVLSRQEMADRPNYFKDFMVDDQKSGGIAMSNGPQWLHDRRFMIRNLRNLGMGKSYLEDAMNIEAQALMEDLKKYAGQPVNFPDSLRTAPLNIIWQMMAGRRYDLRSPDVNAIYKASKELMAASGMALMLPVWFPVLNSIPLPSFISRKYFKTNLAENYTNSIGQIVDEAVAEHEKNFDPNNLHDLIDEYLFDMKVAEEKNEPHYFRKGALLQIVADAFDAGSDTVNYSLRWIIYLLARYPDLAQKMQKQVDEILSRDQLVSSNDKPKLPLIESFVTEMFRYSCFVMVTFEREASKDTSIAGHVVSKGTAVKSVVFTMHFDPNIFDEPHQFRPDRFLDQDGKFQAPKEGIFLFGGGRRVCPAENLARAEVFLFTVAILQNFDIQVPVGATLVEEPVELPEFGLRVPKDQKLIYKVRL